MKTKSHIYLAKANNDLLSYCKCKRALITHPPQMDCPWCGCGWLFSCIKCRKAFTFAVGVEVKESWEDTAIRDIRNGGWEEKPSKNSVKLWITAMKAFLEDVEPGQTYVYLDGYMIPIDAEPVQFEGWHSRHDFKKLPQVAALKTKSIVDKILGNRNYWQKTALESA